MHAGLSNWRWFRTLVWLIGQVPTLDLDPNCPLLPFFWFSRISLSSSFGPHVDFSQRDLKVVHTQERQEHKHHFAWKKKLVSYYQKMAKLRLQNHAGFFLKRRKYLKSGPFRIWRYLYSKTNLTVPWLLTLGSAVPQIWNCRPQSQMPQNSR